MWDSNSLHEIISVFANAIDTINPILKNHHRRTAIIAYYIGKEYGLTGIQLSNLVFAASLHDIGAITVKDKQELQVLDVEYPRPHELLGAGMLESFKPFKSISNIIRHHHVHVSDEKLNIEQNIPIECFILHLADRIEILSDQNEFAINQADEIINKLNNLADRFFDKTIYNVFLNIAKKEFFWYAIEYMSINELFAKLESKNLMFDNSSATTRDLVFTLCKVVDYKSKFTASHSACVAYVARKLAKQLNMSTKQCLDIELAGYMHDFGKIAIPSEILEKPGPLTKQEYNIMKSHPYFSYEILKSIKGFSNIAKWAGLHHEKKDFSGYPRKPQLEELGLESEIICYADVFAALSENRPYRRAMPFDKVMSTIQNEYRIVFGETVFLVLEKSGETLYEEIKKIRSEIDMEYKNLIFE